MNSIKMAAQEGRVSKRRNNLTKCGEPVSGLTFGSGSDVDSNVSEPPDVNDLDVNPVNGGFCACVDIVTIV